MLARTTLLDYLVVDTGPLIRNIKLDALSERVVTTPGVVAELRDSTTRQRLQLTPIEIEQRLPSDKALKFVTEFAKQTGDIRSLSAVDLAVVALTYDLESSINGTEHLRTSPVTSINVNKGFGDDLVTNLAGFYVPFKKSDTSSVTTGSRTTSICSNMEPVTDNTAETGCDDRAEGLVDSLDQCELEEGWSTVPKRGKSRVDSGSDDMVPHDMLLRAVQDDDIEFEEDEESDENEDDWITPSNISEKNTESLASIRVGCTTTDFAMQNILLQIGLHVVSVDGMLIKYAKTYVLKCVACFTVVSDCARMFCTRCGNRTLEKVAVTVDEEGVTWHQRLSKKPRTGRGVRYSLPTPKGGRSDVANMPWITEDQPDKKNRMVCTAKRQVNVMSTDYVKSGGPFGLTNVDAKSFRHMQPAGRRRNPNERKTNTGNRKKKKS